jgi:hypothetical protein
MDIPIAPAPAVFKKDLLGRVVLFMVIQCSGCSAIKLANNPLNDPG